MFDHACKIGHEGYSVEAPGSRLSGRALQGSRVPGFFPKSMFSEETTNVEMHSVDVDGIERDVVGLCEDYLTILRREVEAIQASGNP